MRIAREGCTFGKYGQAFILSFEYLEPVFLRAVSVYQSWLAADKTKCKIEVGESLKNYFLFCHPARPG